MLRSFISRLPNICKTFSTSRLSTLSQPLLSQKPVLSQLPLENKLSLLRPCSPITISVRTNVRVHYRPSALKRIRKHGLEARLKSKSGREVLCRRYINGRWTLTTFDRVTNHLPDVEARKKKRVQLSDKQKGYRSKVKKPEYFMFLT